MGATTYFMGSHKVQPASEMRADADASPRLARIKDRSSRTSARRTPLGLASATRPALIAAESRSEGVGTTESARGTHFCVPLQPHGCAECADPCGEFSSHQGAASTMLAAATIRFPEVGGSEIQESPCCVVGGATEQSTATVAVMSHKLRDTPTSVRHDRSTVESHTPRPSVSPSTS